MLGDVSVPPEAAHNPTPNPTPNPNLNLNPNLNPNGQVEKAVASVQKAYDNSVASSDTAHSRARAIEQEIKEAHGFPSLPPTLGPLTLSPLQKVQEQIAEEKRAAVAEAAEEAEEEWVVVEAAPSNEEPNAAPETAPAPPALAEAEAEVPDAADEVSDGMSVAAEAGTPAVQSFDGALSPPCPPLRMGRPPFSLEDEVSTELRPA